MLGEARVSWGFSQGAVSSVSIQNSIQKLLGSKMLNRNILLDFLCPLEEGQMSSDMCGLKASSHQVQ